jgi:8-oxo-dGTP diphosphatase
MIFQIAVALIRKADSILLVRQQGQDDPLPYWALPGGMVETGELFTEALIREVQEETGLKVTAVGKLIYLVQTVSPASESSACVFEVTDWTGTPHVTDDAYVNESAYVPTADALVYLKHLPFLNMREPILAYLCGEVAAGAVWFYRTQSDGDQVLVTRLAP